MKIKQKLPLLFLTLSLSILFYIQGFSQDSVLGKIVDVNYSGEQLSKVLDDLGQQLKVDFYYKKDDVDDQLVSIQSDDRTAESILSDILETTRLGFLEYGEGSVIIIPRTVINQTLSVNYYEAREEASKASEKEENIVIGSLDELKGDGMATVTGTILDAENEEGVIGATVIVQNTDIKTITDIDGNFEVEVPAGVHFLNISYVGYEDLNLTTRVLSSGTLQLTMEKGAVILDEVTVSAQSAESAVNNTQAGVTKIDVGDIKKLPSFMGETDVVKTLLLNTGVSSSGEGATGFNVRGGDVDQNLILQDNGILLNSSHSLGFFSYFNTDFIEEVQLYKAIMPAQYGGRLSSVLDVKTKEGDFEKWHIRGGVGPVTSRLSIDGPIVKDKVSVIVGGRGSYADWILNAVENQQVRNSSIFFYDANAKISAKLGNKNTLVFSGYASEDAFTYNNAFGFDYTNYTGQVSLRSIFSNKLSSNLSLGFNDYKSSRTDFDPERGSILNNDVSFYQFKERLTYSPNSKTTLVMGLSSILYQVDPGTLEPTENSILIGRSVPQEDGLESAVFANMDYDVNYSIGISAGLRYSDFRFLGPSIVNQYVDPENPSSTQVTGQSEFGSGEVIASFGNLEPRLSMRFRLTRQSSFKTGYSRTVQYINQIFNSETPTPVSQWQLSNNYIPPTKSHNFSAGYFRNFASNNWEANAEVFYRSIDQLFDYKDFASLTANQNIETEILDGIGRSYGLELSVKKKEGVLNGNLNYTYSRSQRQIAGINKGDFYSSNFDKPHDMSFVLNYQPNRRNSVTLNFIYASGRPVTPPVGNYTLTNGLVIPVFSSRNSGRIPDYHRLDLSFTVGKSYKRDKKYTTSWTFSLYNVYARKNAYSIYFTEAPGQRVQANRLALLGTVFPSLTFNFETL
ncbi:TonB-dependent receptor [Portibacter marinus]|uniref:TonB-dependent receptor n=1 Tax=Portibacter marinus TaxID=2898660 RepID=UPI001F3DCD26|nr:carboxypeptidase-like regulatory domain-containing protein [Portibacter marinus]